MKRNGVSGNDILGGDMYKWRLKILMNNGTEYASKIETLTKDSITALNTFIDKTSKFDWITLCKDEYGGRTIIRKSQITSVSIIPLE
jgi:hypothetical protein